MLRQQNRKAGQSVVEFAVLIAVLVAAFIAIQIYLKRGWEGRGRDASDQIGRQFSTLNTTYNYTSTYGSIKQENAQANGLTTTTLTNETQNRFGNEQTGVLAGEKLYP